MLENCVHSLQCYVQLLYAVPFLLPALPLSALETFCGFLQSFFYFLCTVLCLLYSTNSALCLNSVHSTSQFDGVCVTSVCCFAGIPLVVLFTVGCEWSLYMQTALIKALYRVKELNWAGIECEHGLSVV